MYGALVIFVFMVNWDLAVGRPGSWIVWSFELGSAVLVSWGGGGWGAGELECWNSGAWRWVLASRLLVGWRRHGRLAAGKREAGELGGGSWELEREVCVS